MRFFRCLPVLLAGASVLSLGAAPALTNNPSSSQRRPSYQGATPGNGADRLSEELKLSEDQKTKVQAVFDEMREKVQTAILEARTNAESELHHILTPEQYQKLQNLLQQGPHSPPPSQGSNPPRQ